MQPSFVTPVPHRITQGFGRENTHPEILHWYEDIGMLGHNGIDFGCPTGTPIKAPENLKIDWIDTDPVTGYGKAVYAYSDEYMDADTQAKRQHVFGHLSGVDSKYGAGDYIEKGTVFCYSGDTGKFTTGPHMHWGVRLWHKTGGSTKTYNEGWQVKDYDNGYFGYFDPLPFVHDEPLAPYQGKVIRHKDSPRHWLVSGNKIFWIRDEVAMACSGFLFDEAIEVNRDIIDFADKQYYVIPNNHKTREVKQLMQLLVEENARARTLYKDYFK